jgi:hypothetical protein
LVVAFVVGKRTQAEANLLLERVAHVTTDLIPFLTSDQLAEYRTALPHMYGEWYQPPRRGTRGSHPHPRRVSHQELRYAQVVKPHERGGVVAVDHHVVFGDAQHIAALLATLPTSVTINTSFVERKNLALVNTIVDWRARPMRSAKSSHGWKNSYGCRWRTRIWFCRMRAWGRNCRWSNRPAGQAHRDVGSPARRPWQLA